MLRRIVLSTGALALGLGVAAGTGAGTAGATKPPTQLSGAVTCTSAAMLKFSPKLTNAGTASETVTLRARLTGCSGAGATSGGITLTGGNLLATTTTPFATGCGPVTSGTPLPAFSGTLKWKSTGGRVAASAVTVSGVTLYYSSGADTLTAYIGSTSADSGSFSGQHLTFGSETANKDAYKTTSACEAGGIGSVKFGASGGTVSVGA